MDKKRSSEEPSSTTSNTGSTTKSRGRGIFVFERESVVMRKWQILEFNGKPYYAFIPEDEVPIKEEDIPEYPDSTSIIVEEEEGNSLKEAEIIEQYDDSMDEEWLDEPTPQAAGIDIKPVVANGKVQSTDRIEVSPPVGDLYQVKVEAGVVLLEKLNVETLEPSQQATIAAEAVDITEDVVQEMVDVNDDDDDADDDDDEEEAFVETSTESAKKALKCKLCSETFETHLAFRKHVAWTHKKKICIQENGAYICSVCDYRTTKKSLFAAHLQRKHETYSRRRQSGAANFPCQACNFVCRSKHSLQSHFIRKHTDRYEHQCTFCEKKFKVKGDLTNHVRFHHKEKPVNCDVCGKLCLNSGSLYVHQKWAHYKPKFECTICKRRMVTQENLDQHMVMQHEKREKIVCAECGKTFTKKDSFKRHMAVHTGAKPYSCVICNKPFARRSQLRQHLLIHTGKRPFVCDICGKAFTQKPGLICHRKTHPGKHPPLPVMPIGDIVKEFTENYLAVHAPGKTQEGLEDDVDDPETEEDEEYYEEEEEEEEELLEHDFENDGQEVVLGQ